jgi:hypothetical protein
MLPSSGTTLYSPGPGTRLGLDHTSLADEDSMMFLGFLQLWDFLSKLYCPGLRSCTKYA